MLLSIKLFFQNFFINNLRNLEDEDGDKVYVVALRWLWYCRVSLGCLLKGKKTLAPETIETKVIGYSVSATL